MSLLSRLRSKGDGEQKKLLKRVEAKAQEAELKKVKAEKEVKNAKDFLKQVEVAKRRGTEKARVGKRTVCITTLLKSAESKLDSTEAKLKKAEKTYKKAERVGSKARDIILGPSPKRSHAKRHLEKKRQQ